MSRPRRRHLLLCFLAVSAASALVVAVGAGAIEPPKELSTVCVDKRGLVYQAAGPSVCASGEKVFRLPQDRPFRACADLRSGQLRHVASTGECSASKERPVVVPDDGAVYVCSGNIQGGTTLNRGLLRRVDDAGQCNPRAETPYVTPAAPLPVDDAYTVGEDDLLDVPARGVLVNDKDLTGAPLVARLVAGPATGALSFRGDGGFQYDPRGRFDTLDEGQKATQTFRYVADDGALESAPATATLTVTGRNDAPVARPDGYSTPEDDVLTVPARGVLANDTDAEGNPVTAVLVSGPEAGRLALNPDGSFTYDPAGAFEELREGQTAAVSFSYLTRDGAADSAAVRATITIAGRNDAPVPSADGYATDENTVLRVVAPGVLGNDRDAEAQALRAELVTGPVRGTLPAFGPDGSFEFDPRAGFDDLEAGRTATATFTYRAVDAGGTASAPATVTITVAGRSAPVLVDDTATTDEDTASDIAVAANDRLHGGTIDGVSADQGTATLGAQPGVVRFTPGATFQNLAPGATRAATLTYTAANDEGRATARTTVTVTGVNDAPVAVDDDKDKHVAREDATLTVSAADGVLSNDTDAEGTRLEATLVSPPSKGRLNLERDGSFSFTPAGDLTDGQTDTVSFAYRATDGRLESQTARATIRVNGVNDPPVVGDQSFSVAEGSAAGSTVGTIAFSDPDPGQSHTFAIESGNGAGAFALDPATGALTVADPTALDHETRPVHELVVRVRDAGGLSDTGRMHVTVTDVAEGALAAGDAYTATGGTRLVAGGAEPGATVAYRIDARSVLANDRDPDGTAVRAVPDSGATTAGGAYDLAGDGSFTYDPPPGHAGPDSFGYALEDGASATVTVTVAGLVWYVDGSSPFGDGTSIAPYPSVGSVAAGDATDADGPGDVLYLAGDHVAGSLALEDDQRLVGRGAALEAGGAPLVTQPGAPTVLTASDRPAVTLATDNDIRGVDLFSTAHAALHGRGFGTLTAAIARVDASGAPALDLGDGSVEATFGLVRSASSTASGIELDGLQGTLTAETVSVSGSLAPAVRSISNAAVVTLRGGSLQSAAGGVAASGGGSLDIGAAIATGGGRSVEATGLSAAPTGCTLALRGPVEDTGGGVRLHDNAAGSRVCFSGPVTLSTGAQDAFQARDGGTLVLAGTANAITTTTGTGLRLERVAIGADGVTFRTLSTDGAASGIVLDAVGGPGRVSIAGTGAPAPGGTIKGATTGVSITDTSNVSLTGLTVPDAAADAVRVLDSDAVALKGLTVADAAADGVHAEDADGLVVEASTISRALGDGIDLETTSGALVRRTTVEDSGMHGLRATRSQGLRVDSTTVLRRSQQAGALVADPRGTTAIDATTFSGNRGDGQLLVRSGDPAGTAPATADVVRLTGTSFDNGPRTAVSVEAGPRTNLRLEAGVGGGTPNFVTGGREALTARAADGGKLDVSLTRLLAQNATGDAVVLSAAGGSAASSTLTYDLFDDGNATRIIAPQGAGVRLLADPGGELRGSVRNLRLDRPSGSGIAASAAGAGAVIDTLLEGNEVTQPGCTAPGGVTTGTQYCVPEESSCPSAPSTLPTGVTVTSRLGGTFSARIRSNTVTDALGAGILLDTTGTATALVSGNTVRQTLGCSFRGTDGSALAARSRGGNLTITGGANAFSLTAPGSDVVSLATTLAGTLSSTTTADLLEGGRNGIAGSAAPATELEVDTTRLTRTGGTGTGVFVGSDESSAELDVAVRDGRIALANGTGPAGVSGVAVLPGAAPALATAVVPATVTVTGTEIGDAARHGVIAAGPLDDLTITGNTIARTQQSAVLTMAAPDMEVSRNRITDTGLGYVLDPFTPTDPPDAVHVRAGDGRVDVDGNTISGHRVGDGIAVEASPSEDLALALGIRDNDITSPSALGRHGVDVTASGAGSTCLDLARNTAPSEHGFSLAGALGLLGYLPHAEQVSDWVARKLNTGSVSTTGDSFHGC